jgi:hypothetical protein
MRSLESVDRKEKAVKDGASTSQGVLGWFKRPRGPRSERTPSPLTARSGHYHRQNLSLPTLPGRI